MTILEEITAYAHDCIDGDLREKSGKKHRWACMRLIRDIGRVGSDGFPYVWDEERAQSIVDTISNYSVPKHQTFIAQGPHEKAHASGQPQILP